MKRTYWRFLRMLNPLKGSSCMWAARQAGRSMARRPANSRLPIWKPVAEGERVHDESLLLEEIVSHLQHHGTFRRLAAWRSSSL